MELRRIYEKLRKLSPSGAEILGAHIEGPYISIAKKGAQPVENIMTSFDEKDADFFSRNADVLKIVTLCPATKNAVALVKAIVGNGIKAQAGHDDSIDDQIIRQAKSSKFIKILSFSILRYSFSKSRHNFFNFSIIFNSSSI